MSPSKFKVIISAEAYDDLERMFKALAKTREDAVYVKKHIEGIIAAALSLSTFPGRGNWDEGAPANFLYILHKKHKLFYAINDEQHTVVLLRVVHSSLSYKDCLLHKKQPS